MQNSKLELESKFSLEIFFKFIMLQCFNVVVVVLYQMLPLPEVAVAQSATRGSWKSSPKLPSLETEDPCAEDMSAIVGPLLNLEGERPRLW